MFNFLLFIDVRVWHNSENARDRSEGFVFKKSQISYAIWIISIELKIKTSNNYRAQNYSQSHMKHFVVPFWNFYICCKLFGILQQNDLWFYFVISVAPNLEVLIWSILRLLILLVIDECFYINRYLLSTYNWNALLKIVLLATLLNWLVHI